MNLPTVLGIRLFRTLFFLLIAVGTIASFNSCKKDPVITAPDPVEDPMDDPGPEILISHAPDLFTGDIYGQVVDENLAALAGVTIDIRGQITETDDNGNFNLRAIELDALGTLVTASRDNYWSVTKMVALSKAQSNQTRFVLLPKTEQRMVEATTGGMVNFNDAVKIDFPANAFVTSSGLSYEGTVEVAAVHLDPADENFGALSPGDFRAFNADSELQTLLSLGMAGVELRGANNEILELKADQPANLFVKAPAGTQVTEVPLWHFDETSGYWLEEGLAQREGDFFVGAVSHFSWWNCDVPFSAVKLSGSIVNDLGIGVSGLPVTIILADQDQNLGDEYTGDQGMFCGWIPKDENLIIQIRNECGVVFHEQAIGPFSVDTDLTPITVVGQNTIQVCGNLLDCDGELVTDGYLVIQYEGHQSFTPVDANGNFCTVVNICDATSFDLFGLDLVNGQEGMTSTYSLADSPINNLALSACGQLSTFFSYQINNDPEVLVSDFTVSLDNDGVLGFGSSSEIYYIYPGVILDGDNWGSSNFDFGYFNVQLASVDAQVECDFFSCDKPLVEIIDFSGVGNPIRLKIVGTSYDGDSYTINLSGMLE